MTTSIEFPFAEHRTCLALTRLSIERLPQDGSLGRIRKLHKGADLWHPDDAAECIYFVERGDITIFSGDPRTPDVILQSVSIGEPFGELCFCAETGGIRHTIATAMTDTTVLEISYSVFLAYLRGESQALSALICTLCVRLSDCETRTEILARRGAQERLGHLLVQLATKVQRATATGKDDVVLRMSHVELAQMAAMSRAHVTVTLGHFRQQGLIQYSRDRALTVNLPVLVAYIARRPV